MKTSILAATVSALSLAKSTGLLLSFNFGKLHIQGQAQEVSVTTEGAAIKGDLYQVDTTVDFDAVDLATLQSTVLDSLNSAVVLTVTDDRELLITHMFKTVCSSQALKALKAIEGISEEEKNALNMLNRADTFIRDLLPRIMCAEPVIRISNSAAQVLTVDQLAAVGITKLDLIARDDNERLLAAPYKHTSLGNVYKITYNYLIDSDIAGKILSKLQTTGSYKGKTSDKHNRLVVYLAPLADIDDSFEI